MAIEKHSGTVSGAYPAARRCKVGDLAFVLRSCSPSAIGRIVKVMALEAAEPGHLGQWLVQMQGAPVWLPTEKRSVLAGWISDGALLPLRGGDGDLNESTSEPKSSHTSTREAPRRRRDEVSLRGTSGNAVVSA